MSNGVRVLADRIMGIDWTVPVDRVRSRGYLMKEFLRRSAWWAEATGSPQWPFFDIAAAVDPAVRADPALVAWVQEQLHERLQPVPVLRECARALHFQALVDSGVPMPAEPPRDPYEPLIVMFERGGGFRLEGGGLIDVDSLGIVAGPLEANLSRAPVVDLDPDSLDALDEA
jgi:hypothetical protein